MGHKDDKVSWGEAAWIELESRAYLALPSLHFLFSKYKWHSISGHKEYNINININALNLYRENSRWEKDQWRFLLTTGTFFRDLWLMILNRRAMPETQGITTSVKTRSIRFSISSKIFQACNPFDASTTARFKNCEIRKKKRSYSHNM